MEIINKIINRFLKKFQISRVDTPENVVYLTFDDGPEPGICEFVLEELSKFGFTATFFCRGDNAEKNPLLLRKIVDMGETVRKLYPHRLSCWSVE